MNRLLLAFFSLLLLATTAHAQDRKPLIGVEANLVRDPVTGERKAKVAEAYLQAVRDAGGEPILLTPLTMRVDAVLGRLDGIVLTGGDDVPPSLYGEEPKTNAALVDPERLAFGKELVTKALERGVPILGICYGHQLLNVLLGGKLDQDIPDHRKADEHEKGEVHHEIQLATGSRLLEIFGVKKLEVNSFHHQAVKLVGRGLRAVAKAADGIVEAVESLDPAKFILGVQFHPERLAKDHAGRRVFDKLVTAAKDFRAARPADAVHARDGVIERAESTGITRLLARVEDRDRERTAGR